MIVAIAGASGFVGRHLVNKLVLSNHMVVALTRSPKQCRAALIQFNQDLQELINKKLFIIDYEEIEDLKSYEQIRLLSIAGEKKANYEEKRKKIELKHDNVDQNLFAKEQISLVATPDNNVQDNTNSLNALNKTTAAPTLSLFDSNGQPFISNIIKSVRIVINLAGENIAERPICKKRIYALVSSRTSAIKSLERIFCTDNFNEHNVTKKILFIQASATGIYKDSKKVQTESSGYNSMFLGEIASTVEQAARDSFGRSNTTILRFGNILGKDGGMYDRMRKLPAFNLIDGFNYFPIVHIDDVINAILFIIKKSLIGTCNVVCPQRVTIRQVLSTINHGRITALFVPSVVFKLMDSRSCVLLLNQNVIPRNLIEAGFKFLYPTLDAIEKEITS